MLHEDQPNKSACIFTVAYLCLCGMRNDVVPYRYVQRDAVTANRLGLKFWTSSKRVLEASMVRTCSRSRFRSLTVGLSGSTGGCTCTSKCSWLHLAS